MGPGPSRLCSFLSVTTPSEDVARVGLPVTILSPHSEDLSQKESSIERTELRKEQAHKRGKRAHDIHGLVLGHTYPLSPRFEQNWSFCGFLFVLFSVY